MTNSLQKKKGSQTALFIRIVTDLLFLALVAIFPWWVVLPVGLVLMFRLDSYELVLGGLLMDALYATGTPTFLVGEFLFTTIFLVAATVLYFVHEGVKSYLRI